MGSTGGCAQANQIRHSLVFFETHAHRIFHVQLADAPGRHEPGTGELDFKGLFAALSASQYQGWLGVEYIPLGEVRSGMRWLSELDILAEIGEHSGAKS